MPPILVRQGKPGERDYLCDQPLLLEDHEPPDDEPPQELAPLGPMFAAVVKMITIAA